MWELHMKNVRLYVIDIVFNFQLLFGRFKHEAQNPGLQET